MTLTMPIPLHQPQSRDSNYAALLNHARGLEKTIQDLELIIESTYEAIVVSDPKGVIIKANKSLERLTGGIKPEELLGRTAVQLEQDGYIIAQSKRIIGRNPLTIIQKVKTGVELLVTSNRVTDENGRVLCFVATVRDMSYLQHFQQELKETRDLSRKYFSELQELRHRCMDMDDVIINSPEMMAVMEKVFKVARTEANVLLTGETGVGKEVVAKMLHKMSHRKDAPFIQINCGAIPEALLESELFGYEKGAFTDASRNGKTGFFEVANCGTILLDEIGDMPLNLQVKLLRVIQEKEIYRIGGTKPIKLDIRILAATNRSLAEMVKTGRFREDLYYRLNVVPVEIPPLRKRKSDIMPMVYVFLKKYNKKHELQKKMSPEVCSILENYCWPGNVRELKNMIEHLVIISDQFDISLEHVSEQLLKYKQSLFKCPAAADVDDAVSHTSAAESGNDWQRCREVLRQGFAPLLENTGKPPLLKHARELAELCFLELAMEKFKSQRKTARMIGIDHTTLARKLKKPEQENPGMNPSHPGT